MATKHQLRARQAETPLQAQADSQLSPEQMAAYVRQSTTKQTRENLESADLQLSGAQRYAVSQGLDADKIVVAHEGEGKRGVSGTLRIDQRDKLRDIMLDVEAGKIKVIWAYSVSRLFRDKYGVQVGTFIEMCAKHGVKVVIETAQTFDFRDQMHMLIFQILANVAAKENDDRARLMQGAKAQKAQRGEYHGRVLVPGFIVDRDKPSNTYGKFVEYEPHADVTRALYARYRELNGQFNVLASEVASMPYVYPDFEPWVDPRDVAQFRLKKVEGGYTMGKNALRNLLVAVEVVGYWKFNGELLTNEDGMPKKNHDGIVPMDDFLYAFNRLSWDTLEGEDNQERYDARATWKPVKQDRQEPLLAGMLTTPNGTVQYTKGTFRVMEMRPNHPAKSTTLTVSADLVGRLFLCRLQGRYMESSQETYDKIIEELTRVQASNAQALVSVAEQIARYEKSIANKQAVLAALGESIDVPTAQKYNADIKADRANLNALREKKNAAAVEESQLRELRDKIIDVLKGDSDRDVVRRFIKLATDKIELAECSAHFATLTVYWSSPFAQVDVCYVWLANGVHENWEDDELARLRELYPSADRLAILQAFPTRSWSALMAIALDRGMKRYTSKNSSDLPIQLAMRDQEIIGLLGFNPGSGYEDRDLWVNNVSEESLLSRDHK